MKAISSVILVLALGSPMIALGECAAVIYDLSQRDILSVTNNAKTCTVPDGGYAKAGTTYLLHAAATVTGKCQTYVFDAVKQQCVPSTLYDRTAVRTVQKINGGTYGYIYGNSGVQNYDTCANWPNCTRVNTLSNGSGWTPNTSGSYVYDGRNIVGGGTVGNGPYYCNMGGDFPADNSVTLNALKCEPKWAIDSNGNLVHLIPNTIQVFLDPNTFSGATTALDSSIADWNSQVSTTGVIFERVSAPCGTSPSCIVVQAVSDLGRCGFSPEVGTDSNGGITGNIYLQLDASWSTWSSDSLQRTFARELGHRLGLGDYNNACDTTGNSAVMQNNFVCGPTSTPLKTVNTNDYLPVNNTVYGSHSRATCGW